MKRGSERTKCSDLVPSAHDPGKVDARTAIHPPLIQDERWPLTQDDPQTLVVDIRRRTEEDRMQIEASHVVTSALMCNTNHQLLRTEEQARSAGFYSVRYCGKDQVKPKIILPVLHMMDKTRESKHKDTGTDERDAMFWLTRALNNYTSICEFSDTQVARALMGIDSLD